MEKFLDCKGAAKFANCSEATIKRAINSGQLTAYKPGRKYVISQNDLVKYIRNREVKR